MITELQKKQLTKLKVQQLTALKLLHKGMNNPEIAEAMNRSRKTVEFYVHSTYDVLGVRNRVEAALLYERMLKDMA